MNTRTIHSHEKHAVWHINNNLCAISICIAHKMRRNNRTAIPTCIAAYYPLRSFRKWSLHKMHGCLLFMKFNLHLCHNKCNATNFYCLTLKWFVKTCRQLIKWIFTCTLRWTSEYVMMDISIIRNMSWLCKCSWAR